MALRVARLGAQVEQGDPVRVRHARPPQLGRQPGFAALGQAVGQVGAGHRQVQRHGVGAERDGAFGELARLARALLPRGSRREGRQRRAFTRPERRRAPEVLLSRGQVGHHEGGRTGADPREVVVGRQRQGDVERRACRVKQAVPRQQAAVAPPHLEGIRGNQRAAALGFKCLRRLHQHLGVRDASLQCRERPGSGLRSFPTGKERGKLAGEVSARAARAGNERRRTGRVELVHHSWALHFESRHRANLAGRLGIGE